MIVTEIVLVENIFFVVLFMVFSIKNGQPGLAIITITLKFIGLFIIGLQIAFVMIIATYLIQNAWKAFGLLFVCWLLSSMFAIAGFKAELSNLTKIVSEDILLVWLMWEMLETKEDFKFLYKYVTILIFASCVYGLIEYAIKSNPLTLYEATLIHDETRSFVGLYTNMDRGYRIKSIFEHAIGAGSSTNGNVVIR